MPWRSELGGGRSPGPRYCAELGRQNSSGLGIGEWADAQEQCRCARNGRTDALLRRLNGLERLRLKTELSRAAQRVADLRHDDLDLECRLKSAACSSAGLSRYWGLLLASYPRLLVGVGGVGAHSPHRKLRGRGKSSVLLATRGSRVGRGLAMAKMAVAAVASLPARKSLGAQGSAESQEPELPW